MEVNAAHTSIDEPAVSSASPVDPMTGVEPAAPSDQKQAIKSGTSDVVKNSEMSVVKPNPQPSGPSLESLQKLFQSKDYIMDINIMNSLKQFIAAGGKPQNVVQTLAENYRGYAQMCNTLCLWLNAAGMEDDAINLLAMGHLKSLVVQKFDARKADSVFQKSGATPDWLDQMIGVKEWRSLIYKLSEQHGNCMMLQFAIQCISDAGHQDEITSLTTAATYFTVFNRVLLESFTKLLVATEDELPTLLPDFRKMCAYGEHTFSYTQLVIRQLATDPAHPSAGNLKRLAQELEQTAASLGPIVRKLYFHFTDIRRHPDVLLSVNNMIAAASTNPGDIIVLCNLYSTPEPPPIDFLRHPLLLEVLTRDLFQPGRSFSSEHRSKYCKLLALAAAVRDERSRGGCLVRTELDATRKSIEVVQLICRADPTGSELQAVLATLTEHLTYPCVTMGMIFWIGSRLLDKSYYSTTYYSTSTPIYLSLLKEIALKHPHQCGEIHKLMHDCFELETELDTPAALEYRRTVVDVLVFLVGVGYVMPVLDDVERWAVKIDQALVRYFFCQLLDIAAGPFSHPFVTRMLRLLSLSTTSESLKTADEPSRKLIVAFINECVALGFNLPPTETSMLSRLKELCSS